MRYLLAIYLLIKLSLALTKALLPFALPLQVHPSKFHLKPAPVIFLTQFQLHLEFEPPVQHYFGSKVSQQC